jgi:hypothetical protein
LAVVSRVVEASCALDATELLLSATCVAAGRGNWPCCRRLGEVSSAKDSGMIGVVGKFFAGGRVIASQVAKRRYEGRVLSCRVSPGGGFCRVGRRAWVVMWRRSAWRGVTAAWVIGAHGAAWPPVTDRGLNECRQRRAVRGECEPTLGGGSLSSEIFSSEIGVAPERHVRHGEGRSWL